MMRIERGNPTAEELAALVAVLASRANVERQRKEPRPLWSKPQLRSPFIAGVGAWRTSALPTDR